jgi:hypothetical protein
MKITDPNHVRQLTPYFARQLTNFAQAILADEPLLVPGQAGLRTIEVIERCKQTRQFLEPMPWTQLNQEVIRRLDL